jgi:hypothetical protein
MLMTWKDLNFCVPLTRDDKRALKINRIDTIDGSTDSNTPIPQPSSPTNIK